MQVWFYYCKFWYKNGKKFIKTLNIFSFFIKPLQVGRTNIIMPPYSFILNGNFVDILRNQFQEFLATIPSQDTRVEREQWGIDWWIYHEGHHLRHCRADYFFRSPTERAIIRQVCAAKEKSLVYYLSVLNSFSKNIGMSLLWSISSQRWCETWDEKEVFVGEGITVCFA